MFQLASSLFAQTVYKNQICDFEGIRGKVKAIFDKRGSEKLTSLVAKKQTKFEFFSRSCQVQILIEMAREMYTFDEEGILLSEKCLQFIRAYFEKCKLEGTSHEVTITMCARVFYP
jgi:hypothetical protein